MSNLFKEFREFAVKGNVIDMAVGVILGVAFGKIITSLVNDILMPPIGILLGKVDFSNLFIDLSGKFHESLAIAKASGASTINYGIFLNTVIDFLIVSFVIFLTVRQFNKLKQQIIPDDEINKTKECPYCFTSISSRAKKCAYCTSDLEI